jgi:hypothetical protein
MFYLSDIPVWQVKSLPVLEGFKLLYGNIHYAVNLPQECFFVRFVCFVICIISVKDKSASFSSQIIGEFNYTTNVYLKQIH